MESSAGERTSAPMRAALVGRDAELVAIDDCITHALGDEPRVVMCHGEPGIGKTRLAEEALARARTHGLYTAWGIADDALPSPPLWPWQQLLRALSATIDLRAIADERRLAATLHAIAPEVFAGIDGAPPATADDRFRQFDAVARLLGAVCRTQPLGLVLDDAHWADEASLLLLRHVVAGLSNERLLLWVNLRDTDQRYPSLLEQLHRRPAVRHLHLAGLTRPAVRDHLASITGRPVTSDEAATVYAVTGGNAFFVSEAARALLEPRDSGSRDFVTAGTRNAVAMRLAKLDGRTASVLRAAAVLGRDFGAAVLAATTGTSEVECLQSLADAERAEIVEPTGNAAFRFVHALVRDAIEAGLDPAERVRLHREAAMATEARHTSDLEGHLFELARHWAAAAPGGDRATAARWLERAADHSMARLGYEDAAALYRDALAVGGGDVDADTTWRLLIGRARSANRAGALADCLDALLAAATSARERGRLDQLAEAALVMDPVGSPGFDLTTRRLCQEVLDQLDDEATPLRARLTARLAETYMYLPDAETAAAASERAVTIAERCGDVPALTSALRARQVVVAHPDGLAERERVAVRMIELGERTAAVDIELRGRLCRVDALFERGDLTAVAAELDRCEQPARDVGGPLAPYLVTHARAVLALAQGRLREARRLVDEALAAAGTRELPVIVHRHTAVLSGIVRQVGVDDQMSPPPGAWDGSASSIEKPPFIADLATADVLLHAGQLDAAADLWRLLGPARRWRPPPHVVLIAGALGIEVGAAVGTSDDLDALHALLVPYRDHHVACGLGAAAYMGPVELWLGVAARHVGRLDDAVADLQVARERCRDSGAAGCAVEATVELAAALAARGPDDDRDRAGGLLRGARAAADELGMTVVRARIDDQLRALSAPRAAPLTRREWEVAELVALGLSNRDIAQRLVLSERTAQNHVQHILTKLSLPNRAQVAVWFERSRRER